MHYKNMIITTILICQKDHARLLLTKHTLKKEKRMVQITLLVIGLSLCFANHLIFCSFFTFGPFLDN